MILGIVSVIALFGLLAIAFFKIENLVHKTENKTVLRSTLEFSLSFFLLLFLIFGVNVNAFIASQTQAETDAAALQPMALGDALESAQYLRLGTYLFLGVFGLYLLELLLFFGMVGTRKRLTPTR